jgi:hypothetical protein
VCPLVEPTSFRTYAVVNAEEPLSMVGEALIQLLKQEMAAITRGRDLPPRCVTWREARGEAALPRAGAS